MKKTIYTIGLGLLTALAANAQADTTKKDDGKFTVSGYIDSYYNHALNDPASGNTMGVYANTIDPATVVPGLSPAGYNYGYTRAFDRLTDQFALGLVQTKFTYTNKKSEMVIDLTFGPNAALGNFGNQYNFGAASFSPSNSNQAALYSSSINIKQAYFTYKFTDKLSMTVGQFGTHIGYEVIDAPVNYHYSLSNLFNNGPFYHVGGKVNYAFSDKFGVMLGLVNNWDALTDWKKQKSVIAQVFVSPVTGWNIYLNYIGGHNDDPFKVSSSAGGTVGAANTVYTLPAFFGANFKSTAGTSYSRQLIDLTTGYQVTDKLYFGLNGAYGWYSFSSDSAADEKAIKGVFSRGGTRDSTLNPSWFGVALYANYKLTDMLGIGVRFEHFNDAKAVRYLNTVNNSLTITAPITLASGHLIVKPELRADVSPDAYYEGSKGQNARYNQTTIGCSFIYKF